MTHLGHPVKKTPPNSGPLGPSATTSRGRGRSARSGHEHPKCHDRDRDRRDRDCRRDSCLTSSPPGHARVPPSCRAARVRPGYVRCLAEMGHPLVRALALRGVIPTRSGPGSHLGPPLKPGRPVLNQGRLSTSKGQWRVSAQTPHRTRCYPSSGPVPARSVKYLRKCRNVCLPTPAPSASVWWVHGAGVSLPGARCTLWFRAVAAVPPFRWRA